MQPKREDRAKEAADSIMLFVNDMNGDVETFLTEISKGHRTLQQSFTRLCFRWIEKNAKTKTCDLRNSASIEKCKEIAEKVDSLYLPLV